MGSSGKQSCSVVYCGKAQGIFNVGDKVEFYCPKKWWQRVLEFFFGVKHEYAEVKEVHDSYIVTGKWGCK